VGRKVAIFTGWQEPCDRDWQARICERLGVKFPGPTRPEGYPQTPPYKWWNWHDNYEAEGSPDPKWVDIITRPQGAALRRRDAEAKG
jgi:hypothetical protein